MILDHRGTILLLLSPQVYSAIALLLAKIHSELLQELVAPSLTFSPLNGENEEYFQLQKCQIIFCTRPLCETATGKDTRRR